VSRQIHNCFPAFKIYDPDSGTIYFDERAAGEFPLSQLRRQMAFVPQDVIYLAAASKKILRMENQERVMKK